MHFSFHGIRVVIFWAVWVLLSAFSAASAHAQADFSKFFNPNSIAPGSTTTLTYTIDNSTGGPLTDLAFTNTLPAAITIAGVPNVSHNCDGGNITATAGGGTVSFDSGRLGNGATCQITVDVTSSTVGAHTNPAVTLNSSAGSSMSSPVDLTIVTSLPGFSKTFSPSTVSFGGTTTLTFTIDNTANAGRIGNLDFTDNFPAGMVIASPANASTDCISANVPNTILTAPAGGTSVTLNADGFAGIPGFEVLDAGATCTVTVDVVGNAIGDLENISGDLTADFVSAGGASDTLTVTGSDLLFTKSFTNDPVAPGETVDLEFTIQSQDRANTATALAFTDDLSAVLSGLTFSTLNSNSCGGSVGGVGTSTISLSGGSLAPEASCNISVTLTVPAGAATGSYPNTTSNITATVGGSPVVGDPATDNLSVNAAIPALTKTFLTDPVGAGDTVTLEFTIDNPSATETMTAFAFTDDITGMLSGTTISSLPTAGFCGAGSSMTNTGFSGAVILSMSGGSLAPGGSCTFSVDLGIPAGTAAGTYTNTTSNITATVGAGTSTGFPATDTLTVVGGSVIFTKEFTTDPVSPGGQATLEFTIENPATSPAAVTSLAFTDDLNAVIAGLASTGLLENNICGSGSSLSGTTNVSWRGNGEHGCWVWRHL